ncbi:MAG: sulfatase [Gemmatimonadota bacterium]
MSHPKLFPEAVRSQPIAIILLSLWFALITSWIELGILADRMYLQHRPTFGMNQGLTLWADYRLTWTVPFVDVFILLVPGALIALWAWSRSTTTRIPLAALVAAFLASESVLLNFTWLNHWSVLLLGAGIALQTMRLVRSHPVGFERLVHRTIGWMITVTVLAAVGTTVQHAWIEHRRFAGLPAPPVGPNIVVIILDTVRGFNLSLYGYGRATTPNLDRVARRGVLFEVAFSTAPWTLPSHAGIFTGHYPHELSADHTSPLDATFPTIAEVMAAGGYATAGFVANTAYAGVESGLARGFAHYEDFTLSVPLLLHNSSLFRTFLSLPYVGGALGIFGQPGRKSADQINRDFLRWTSRHTDRPFFAFLNYFDAHQPYLAPAPFDIRYSTSSEPYRRMLRTGGKLPDEAGRILADAYDGTISYLDDRLGRLFDALDRDPNLRNTIVILTSDHGEQFGEHGLFYHSNSLYAQLLRVPLLVFGTQRIPAGLRITTPVSLSDMPATVVDLAGVAVDSPFPGKSLARYWSSGLDSTVSGDPLISELSEQARLIEEFAPTAQGMGSLLDGRLHYIRLIIDRRTGERSEMLYDIGQDPFEERDLSAVDSMQPNIDRLRARYDSITMPGRKSMPR